ESGYCVTVQDEQELELTMFYPGLLLYTKGVGKATRFSPNGTVMLESTGQPYTIELVGNEGHYYGSYYDMTLTGTAGTAQLSTTNDGYLLTSDQMNDVQITGLSDAGLEKLTFSTDADTVLIYENDNHHLAAAIDQDQNGSYETVISATMQLGDLNADSIANSSDAAQILIAAARIGAGEDSGLTDDQKNAADVNADGSINASDSAILLQYAAAAGAGSFAGNLETYVKEVVKAHKE
ncbi:MAG: dockerin type I repeat-containing protein, partial [Oscillospiraceae bacterium]|nr:dockerin type I repeat-containing protein [Oscillospiraceae bacterium]